MDQSTTTLIGFAVVVIGWFVGSWLIAERERRTKRRDIQMQYLQQAYRALGIGLQWRRKNEKCAIEFDQAFADVQLYGSSAQIELLRVVLKSIESTGEADLEPLFQQFRREFRAAMNMEPIELPFRWHNTKPLEDIRKTKSR